MPQTPVAGEGGSCTMTDGANAFGVQFTNWATNLEIDQVEIPAAFGERWKRIALGAGIIRGSFEGRADYDAAGMKPLPMDTSATATTSFTALGFKTTATFTAATGCSISGTFCVYNVSMSRPRNGYMTVSGQFATGGNDNVITWDVVG